MTKKPSQPSRAGKVNITVFTEKAVRDRLKILAVERSTTLHALMSEAIEDLLKKYGKPKG